MSIEVGSRRQLPAWIEDVAKQVEASTKDRRLPMAVFHQNGKKYRDALVVLRLS
jgi:hypothetical protein